MYDYLFGDRDPVAEPGTETGSPGDWWTTFANSPDILEHCVQGFGIYRSSKRKLDPVLRELGQARVGWAAESLFVYSQHCKSLRALEVSEEKIAALPAWSSASCFSDVERAVLAYSDCLVYDHGRVPEELFTQLRKHLSDLEILELTYISSLYFQHAVMSRALRTEFDDVAERIIEVEPPEGSDPRKIGRYLPRNR